MGRGWRSRRSAGGVATVLGVAVLCAQRAFRTRPATEEMPMPRPAGRRELGWCQKSGALAEMACCCSLAREHRVIVGRHWGSLPIDMQAWWGMHSCDTILATSACAKPEMVASQIASEAPALRHAEPKPTLQTTMGNVQSYCCTLLRKHAVLPGAHWGTLSTEQQEQWKRRQCDNLVKQCPRWAPSLMHCGGGDVKVANVSRESKPTVARTPGARWALLTGPAKLFESQSSAAQAAVNANLQVYAALHHMDIHHMESCSACNAYTPGAWKKVPFISRVLKSGDYAGAVWIDGDAAFIDMTIDVSQWASLLRQNESIVLRAAPDEDMRGGWLSQPSVRAAMQRCQTDSSTGIPCRNPPDENDAGRQRCWPLSNTGVMVMMNTSRSLSVLAALEELHSKEPSIRNHGWWDQMGMNCLLLDPRRALSIKLLGSHQSNRSVNTLDNGPHFNALLTAMASQSDTDPNHSNTNPWIAHVPNCVSTTGDSPALCRLQMHVLACCGLLNTDSTGSIYRQHCYKERSPLTAMVLARHGGLGTNAPVPLLRALARLKRLPCFMQIVAEAEPEICRSVTLAVGGFS